MSTHGTLLGNIIVVAMVFGIYFLPTITAAVRQPRLLWWIAPLNLLLGWTVICWMIVFAWAYANEPRDRPPTW